MALRRKPKDSAVPQSYRTATVIHLDKDVQATLSHIYHLLAVVEADENRRRELSLVVSDREKARTKHLSRGNYSTATYLREAIQELEARMSAIAAQNRERHVEITQLTATLPNDVDAYTVFGASSEQ